MELNADEVRALALTARLELGETELAGMTAELAAILDFTAELRPVPEDVPEFERDWHGNVLRDDAIVPPAGQAAALAAAPASEDGFLRVPRTVDADA